MASVWTIFCLLDCVVKHQKSQHLLTPFHAADIGLSLHHTTTRLVAEAAQACRCNCFHSTKGEERLQLWTQSSQLLESKPLQRVEAEHIYFANCMMETMEKFVRREIISYTLCLVLFSKLELAENKSSNLKKIHCVGYMTPSYFPKLFSGMLDLSWKQTLGKFYCADAWAFSSKQTDVNYWFDAF